MTKNQKEEIRQEFLELAAAMEKECGDWQNSPGLSAEAKAALISKVEKLDQERKSGKKKKSTLP